MVSLYSPELLTAQQELLQALRTVEELSRSDVDIVRKTADQTVAAARDKLRLWGLTTEQIAEIEKRDKADDHITIYAPEGGIVVNKNAQEGMYVKTGTRIYTIADLSHLWVNLQAYESDLMWLRYGQDVEFTTEAYPGVVFNGVISFIHPVLDEATRTVKLRVNVQNRDGRLKPGMFVRGRAQASVATEGRVMDPGLAGKWIGPMHPGIVKDHPGNCDICGMPLVKAESLGYVGKQPTDADKPLVIPTSAALITGKRAVVYVEVPDAEKPTFEGREIVLGPRAGDYYLVRRGLAEGEMVVTRGTFKLDAELQIQAKPSMMTPAGGQPPGGHHHGKNAEKTGTMAETGEAAAPSLPVAVQSQLSEVVAQAAAAIDISKGDELNLIRDAYADLGTSVDAVQDRALSGHPAMLWKEYGMLLGNDAAIGVDIKTAEEAGNLAETTRKHLDRMTQAFGLAQNKKAQPEPVEVNPQFTEQLKGLVDAYTEMHDALADDKHQPAKKAASDALDALGKIDMELLRGDAHMQWMKDAENLRDPLQKIAQSDSLETDRTNFAMLSEQMAAVLTRFGVPEGTLYKAWCPMAFQDRGALWLQKTKDIENPYLGHAMPRCGEIKGALK
jgi:Cu(I)/Ag(I) efflux system membrane fusion protein